MRRYAFVLAFAVATAGCGSDHARVTLAPFPSSPRWCPGWMDAHRAHVLHVPRHGTLDVRYLIGVREHDAERMIGRAGCITRIVMRDGKVVQPLLLSDVTSRVDLTVTHGIVVDVGVY